MPPEVVAAHEKRAKRIDGRLLLHAAREVHRHHAARAAARVEKLKRTADKAVVGRHRRHRQRLDARVAPVHLLLVVRAVEEYLVRTHLHGARAYPSYVGYGWIVALEARTVLERIPRLVQFKGGDFKGLLPAFYRYLAPASAPPPGHGELRGVASVADELVHYSLEALAAPLAPVTLETFAVAQRLRPSPSDLRAATAPDAQHGVRAEVVAKVPEERQSLAGRDSERRVRWRAVADEASGADDSRKLLG